MAIQPNITDDGVRTRTVGTEDDALNTNVKRTAPLFRPDVSSKDLRDSSIIESFLLHDPYEQQLDGAKATVLSTILKIAHALFFLTVLLLTAITIQTLQYPCLVFRIAGNRHLYRRCIMFTQSLFGTMISLLSYLLCPSAIRLSGEFSSLSRDKPAILFPNHQIYSDWWWIWILAYHKKAEDAVKIILKDTLRDLPVFGWGMIFFEFIFFARKWEKDRDVLFSSLELAINDKLPLWLIIYPEGTITTEDTLSKTHHYAKKVGIEDLPSFVLIPKATGLYHCINAMHPSCKVIYDITVGYEGCRSDFFPYIVFSIARCFFDGKGPKTVHMHITPINVDDIPGINHIVKMNKTSKELETHADEKERGLFQNWLRKRYELKDELLHYFYEHQKFPEDMVSYKATKASHFDTELAKKHFEKPVNYASQPRLLDFLILVWCIYAVFKIILPFVFTVLMSAIHLVISR